MSYKIKIILTDENDDNYVGELNLYPQVTDRIKILKTTKDGKKGIDVKNINIVDVVEKIKTCDESEGIEKNILDRSSLIDKIILPLYIIDKHFGYKSSLTTGEIAKILIDLGIRIYTPNVSNAFSGAASKYVIGDKIRKRGQPVRYKITKRGSNYIKYVIIGKKNDQS